MRLSKATLPQAQAEVIRLGYEPDEHNVGIVHIGLGAFHRAHQAYYTDLALEQSGGDWRIAAVSMRSTQTAQDLSEQDGLYTLQACDDGASSLRIIASIAKALSWQNQRAEIQALLISPSTKIISLTVTEKAYCIDPGNGLIDLEHADVEHDLAHPDTPISVPGLLVSILHQRQKSHAGGLAILCCDNLPDNGAATQSVVLSLAEKMVPGLSDWINENITFPSSMVDRITPAVSNEVAAEIQLRSGLVDSAPVRAEAFSQWVIEDNFPCGRPDWDGAGASLVDDVRPFEEMKLRMLNGSHSLLAYAGFVSGKATVKACMQDPVLRQLTTAHLVQAAATLNPDTGIDYQHYAADLMARFDNSEIEHLTYQIAMDASQKLKQRIFEPALDAVRSGTPLWTFAFATAAWIRYCQGQTESNTLYRLRDPIEATLTAALQGQHTADKMFDRICAITGLIPDELSANTQWSDLVQNVLSEMLSTGVSNSAKLFLKANR